MRTCPRKDLLGYVFGWQSESLRVKVQRIIGVGAQFADRALICLQTAGNFMSIFSTVVFIYLPFFQHLKFSLSCLLLYLVNFISDDLFGITFFQSHVSFSFL